MHENKKLLRKEIQVAIAAYSPACRSAADVRLLDAAKDVLAPRLPLTVLGYMPLPDEPDLSPLLEWLLQQDARLVLPRVCSDGSLSLYAVTSLSDDLTVGAYGILEPKESLPGVLSDDIDCILVPGRAFTVYGQRLGRGKGFYDRLLTRARSAIKLSLAYDCQVVGCLPVDSHDQPVDILLTPSGVHVCSAQ